MSQLNSRLLLTALLPLFAAGTAHSEEASQPLSLDQLRTFSDVLSTIRRNYVDPVDDAALIDAALQGMADSLDDYSAYLPPSAFKQQDNNARGGYGGIGISVQRRKQRLVVEEVFEEGPAWEAGVKAGDLILKVDEHIVRGNPLHRSMDALLGPPGTEVTVRFRTGNMTPRDLTLIRAYIPVPSVKATLLDDRIALLHIRQFNRRTAEETKAALKGLQATGDEPINGVVLDLRDNPGGTIKSAAELADGFLEEGLVVYTRGRYQGSQLEYNAEPGQWAPTTPLVVLVNRNSASASEILAGALQDHGRGTVLGEETFGKGSVQSILELRNGSALKLTTARYFTPSGRSFDQAGIAPDVIFENPGAPGAALRDDPALQKAVELIEDGDAARGAGVDS